MTRRHVINAIKNIPFCDNDLLRHNAENLALGKTWNGMEWNGMDWNGMEWNGMNWNGMEWNGFLSGAVFFSSQTSPH